MRADSDRARADRAGYRCRNPAHGRQSPILLSCHVVPFFHLCIPEVKMTASIRRWQMTHITIDHLARVRPGGILMRVIVGPRDGGSPFSRRCGISMTRESDEIIVFSIISPSAIF